MDWNRFNPAYVSSPAFSYVTCIHASLLAAEQEKKAKLLFAF
jgi:hypothetical protein